MPVAFRLPCSPTLDAPLGVAAAERRIRKAYFATLDALRTGRVDPDAEAQLTRLTREVRALAVRRALQHLRAVQRFVRREAAGWPVIAAPRTPLVRVVVTAPSLPSGPASHAAPSDAALTRRHAWALDWLRMHRWVAGRGLQIEWHAQERTREPAPARPATPAGVAA